MSNPRRRIHTDDELADLAETLGVPASELERDFLLVNVAAQLEGDFPGALCFKGGFVLRHVHGQRRLSLDIDATRHNPPKHKFDSADVKKSITRAGGGLFRVRVPDPETDSAASLDFGRIAYTGPLGRGAIAVEVSYREELVLDPVETEIGSPFFDPFPIFAMDPHEIVAEKLRTLAQRRRPTDLSDLAYILSNVEIDATKVQEVTPHKFKPGLVQPGDHAARIRENIETIGQDYEQSVRAIAPDAHSYADAAELVKHQLGNLLR